jgi:hypothetical protein
MLIGKEKGMNNSRRTDVNMIQEKPPSNAIIAHTTKKNKTGRNNIP